MRTSVRRSTLNISVTALFTALLAVSAFVTIPLPGGVPVTLQTFAAALTGYGLGVKRAVPALLAYLQSNPVSGAVVLVKGSRGIRMETVLPAL